MKRYKQVLVCLDGSRYDAHLLGYAGGRSRVAESSEVHFLYVADESAGGDAVSAEDAGTSQITVESLRRSVGEQFKGHGGEKLHCQVARGAPLLESLRYAHERDVDLIMLGRHYGRRSEEDQEVVLARRIARKATCSVLVLPEEYARQADALIVPVRDSECSSQALEVACGIAQVSGARVTALNVFRVGGGYSRVGKTLEEHTALLKTAAGRECSGLLKRTDTHGVEVDCNCLPDMRDDPVTVMRVRRSSSAPGGGPGQPAFCWATSPSS
ncbi:MAG: universal stress protein [Planctomycetota bacterium]|jgi:nucleotide-binding universal stress UspA family protein